MVPVTAFRRADAGGEGAIFRLSITYRGNIDLLSCHRLVVFSTVWPLKFEIMHWHIGALTYAGYCGRHNCPLYLEVVFIVLIASFGIARLRFHSASWWHSRCRCVRRPTENGLLLMPALLYRQRLISEYTNYLRQRGVGSRPRCRRKAETRCSFGVSITKVYPICVQQCMFWIFFNYQHGSRCD